MFTGLIREKAKVISFNNGVLRLEANYTPKLGDSIAVNGACLTVIDIFSNGFSVELSPETMRYIASENLRDEVHIEPAMRMGDRFEGHIVQGHIDAIGVINRIEKFGNSWNLYIQLPKNVVHLVMPKGSIAIDGVSLTTNEVLGDTVRITVIPHTMENTIFSKYTAGRRVNIETDIFARYIDNILKKRGGEVTPMSWSDIDSILYSY